ncbi:acylneuraminate cytidylyltransferase family protein [Sphingobacterium gobiense]|uniref:Acylneuraminate cytidylyltransferase family protein n=1 Tax=Sphingobacterium gobiense TaxID=1382456 RepID=A0A2S9JG68_9SPHI|nr:acylneuraminate cytidylyltransferase family protein [Sphingobacterium gobiense]PRD51946.1 acylneuraminate cytidylyltransferase family protein [Sphingobacterium gobiense]
MLAIIPARGGSKGLPGKNIRPLCGKPLIAYTIEAAAKSKYITDVFVSTDSQEIAEIATEWGGWVPELRPNRLASDTAKSIDVIIYTISLLSEKFGKKYDSVVILQPTSPLRTECHIDESIELFHRKRADSVISYTEMEHPIFWSKYIDEELRFIDVFHNSMMSNRQEYKKTYLPNGAIYVVSTKQIETENLYSKKSFAYVMPRGASIDIDSDIDFKLAELLFLMQKNESL